MSPWTQKNSIQKVKITNGVFYPEARSLIVASVPFYTRAYATIAATSISYSCFVFPSHHKMCSIPNGTKTLASNGLHKPPWINTHTCQRSNQRLDLEAIRLLQRQKRRITLPPSRVTKEKRANSKSPGRSNVDGSQHERQPRSKPDRDCTEDKVSTNLTPSTFPHRRAKKILYWRYHHLIHFDLLFQILNARSNNMTQ